MRKAQELGLDLVLVAPTAVPPVAKAVDFGHYQYEQKKKQHDAKKKQHVVQVKELKFRPNTDDHDYDFKKNHAIRFLQEGNRVKAVVQFRGREIAHADLGKKLLMRFAADLTSLRHRRRPAPAGRPQRAHPDQPGEEPSAKLAAKRRDKPQSPPSRRHRRNADSGSLGFRRMLRCEKFTRSLPAMYNAFFGFTQNPFNMSPDPSFLFRSAQHEEALANLIYGVQSRKGFIVLTGEVGTGKTTMLECLRDFLSSPADRFRLPVQFAPDRGAVLRDARLRFRSAVQPALEDRSAAFA